MGENLVYSVVLVPHTFESITFGLQAAQGLMWLGEG
jgi:hypothetical protein